MPQLYEELLYPNINFDDFRSYFMNEQSQIINLIHNLPMGKVDYFDDFLNQKLILYVKAHWGYFMTLDIKKVIHDPIDYGFMSKITN